MWDAEKDDDADFKRHLNAVCREIGDRGKAIVPEAEPPFREPTPAPAPALPSTCQRPAGTNRFKAARRGKPFQSGPPGQTVSKRPAGTNRVKAARKDKPFRTSLGGPVWWFGGTLNLFEVL